MLRGTYMKSIRNKLAYISILGSTFYPFNIYAAETFALAKDYDVPADRQEHCVGAATGTDTTNCIKLVKHFNAGEQMYFLGRGTVQNSTSAIMMFGLGVKCTATKLDDSKTEDPKKPTTRYLQSTRNHLGADAYPSTLGLLKQDVRYLFKAPKAGEYECKLVASNYKGTKEDLTYSWRLLKGAENTFLSWSDSASNVLGSQAWGTQNDPSDRDLAISAIPSRLNEHNTPADPAKGIEADLWDSTAVHLGPSTNTALVAVGTEKKPSINVLQSDKWTPSSMAKSVKAIMDVEMTVCYFGTGSCAKYARGTKDQKNAGSTVYTRMVVSEYKPDSDEPCATTQTEWTKTKIASNTHHQKLYNKLDEITPHSCSANSYLRSKLEVKWAEGNPVRIEPSTYSHSILMNNM